METQLKKKAIKLLENNLEYFNKINNKNQIEIFNTIISFSKNNQQKQAEKLLKQTLKHHFH